MSILCLLFVTPDQIQCPSLYINQALLINAFFKISMYITCCPLSQVGMIFGFVPHPLAYFLISGYLLQTPKNSKISLISLEGLSYRGSTVFD